MMISESIRNKIITITGASSIGVIEEIQPLWNNYGSLMRIFLHGSVYETVILKLIQIPSTFKHPRGFANSHSNQRKIRSYEVEECWYKEYNASIATSRSPTPSHLGSWETMDGNCILLEDLNQRGFSTRLSRCTQVNINTVIRWLAHFHSVNLNRDATGLWESGTYWHLETRPDELREIQGTPLHTFAPFIDAQLTNSQFQTIVHGDAKLANFCFNKSGNEVAAVDFQYVGQGCGMKDLAYFISSCMTEEEARSSQDQILDLYFDHLVEYLKDSNIDVSALISEWRYLYPVAIADFHRFILGWSPTHYKNTSTTHAITVGVMNDIIEELLNHAVQAALRAGEYIRHKWKGNFTIESKGFGSAASDIVTEVDESAQKMIYECLQGSLEKYNLGWLAEEGSQDTSRVEKYAFWTVDPIDGTLFFAEGKKGFAVSIALVNKNGNSLIGVVYDPATHTLYQTTLGKPVLLNDHPLQTDFSTDSPYTLVLDRGFTDHPWFPILSKRFQIEFVGGAVMNVMYLLHNPRSFYMKVPKKRLGGCAIWDLAAASIICQNSDGSAQFFDGSRLHLNRLDRLYFNDVGFVFCGAKCSYSMIIEQFIDLGLIQNTNPITFNHL